MSKVLKRFYSFLLKYKKEFITFEIVLVASAILENLSPYIYKLLIDNITSGNYQILISILFLFVGQKVLSNLSHVLSYYLGDKTLIPAARDARLKIFRHIQDLDFAYHVNKNTGSLISIFKRGDGAFFEMFHSINHEVSRLVISLFVAIFFFVQIDPSIALILVILFTANVFLSLWLVRKNMDARRKFNKSEDTISAIITDNLINYETVKYFAQEEKEEKRLKSKFHPWMKNLWNFANSFRVMDVSVGTLANLGTLLVLWISINKLIKGSIGVGDLVLITSFMTGFYYRFFDLLYRLRRIAKHYIDIRKYLLVLDEPILVKDPVNPISIEKVKGKLDFLDADFSYPDQKQNLVLRDANLSIKPGESVAFVGRSGAGKTTIVKLLLRFYDINQGKITIDGTDITKLTKSHLRSFIGVVPQEPILFNNTVSFNIAYGDNRVTKKRIVKAAKIANIHNFIDSLPKKYETQVGERGIKLSGGQKQRLAIARMLISNPSIIVFDEATSNLDSESEGLIQDALWKVAKGRTVLIIAHRFATIRRVDRIVVMDEGRIKEIGTHKELIAKKGIYQYLWHLQAKGELEEGDDLVS